MALRFSDYRFWVLFSALVVGVLMACSSDNSPSPSGGNDAASSMTQG